MQVENIPKRNRVKSLIHSILFDSKWLLVPFYMGLIIAQAFYCIKFCGNVWELCRHYSSMSENDLMLIVLSLIDITMIANLIKMIITGSYHTFIEKVVDDSHTEQVSSGMLKVKMGSSLIGVSSIHLLQSFINSGAQTNRELFVKVTIHIVFLISTMGLAMVDYLHVKSEILHDKHENQKSH